VLILPAIDLMGGKCVRLAQGRFDEATEYGEPIAQAAAFDSAGAEWIHIVDLDGARTGRPLQQRLLRDLCRSTKARIQCGGGVREWGAAQSLFDSGAARAVIGSAAVSRPDEVRHWLASFGADRICLAFDVRRAGDSYDIAVDGWTRSGGCSLFEALDLYPPGVLKHVLVTDVSRDGVLTGPNTELIAAIVEARPDLDVQASGGVAALSDLTALRTAGAAAAIVGRALYEGRFSLEEARAC
jgi:phosphoribosylformimino-5-aminoimidazole carboxamide ribotide isomerase